MQSSFAPKLQKSNQNQEEIMKRSKILMVLLVGILLLATTATAFAATIEEQRQETRQKVAETLNKLYERKPAARTALKNAEGYAVFASSGIKLGILGASHGRGLAYNNKTGEEIFMRMKEYQAGLGIGAKEYALSLPLLTIRHGRSLRRLTGLLADRRMQQRMTASTAVPLRVRSRRRPAFSSIR
jgi:hypothetical protein